MFLCFSVTNCSLEYLENNPAGAQNKKTFSKQFESPVVVGTITSKEIDESSGIVQSRCSKGVFWTHNDSGNPGFIFALNEKGEKLGTWKVSGAKNVDWEDIATAKDGKGNCQLYIGDIGNNSRTRGELTIYRLNEPVVSDSDSSSSSSRPLLTEKAVSINVEYPDFRHNAESILVHPKTLDIYLLTKRISGAAGIYKLSQKDLKEKNILEKIGDLSVPALPNGLLTGGEISPDGTRVILCDYYNGYELELPKNSRNFDEIWKQDPSVIELGKREQGEDICYSVDMRSIYATSEKQNSPLIRVSRK
ncbi:MAG: hypothetical protein KDB79_09500 [Acidobacteria bacterium]|nr:hypothetical protein [Acidobacteriota bacterium]